MKRFVILFLVSLASITSTQAWSGIGNPATRIFAQKFMTAEARRENSRIWRLSKKYPAEKSEKPTDVRWNRVSLDADLRSTTTYEGDVVVQMERAAEVLRNRANHSEQEQIEAMRTITYNMILLHTFGNISIEGNELTKGFFVQLSLGAAASVNANKMRKYKWQTLWNRAIILRHYGYTADMYAEDLAICHGADKEAFSKGSIRDWAADIGAELSKQLAEAKPGMVVDKLKMLEYETTNDRIMAKAGFRLAALLNDIFK
jgi:hypothetical protein